MGGVATRGVDGLYKGEVARRIANDITADGGLTTAEDLADYRPVESDPLVGSYRGYTIHTAPPASAGGPALLTIWNQLEHFDLKAMGAGSAILLHFMAEAMKLGYVDRARALGAPAFVTAPVKASSRRNMQARAPR
ncbi:MAG: gamma-glutamyltransferase [Sphingopyxis granuli]|uniref:gamma-glutamyltransferase n=1 Tax=Sphingopyxis granuli TaxID=267128 RepID=UPI003C736DC0